MRDPKAIADAIRKQSKSGDHDPMDVDCSCSMCTGGEMMNEGGFVSPNEDTLSHDDEQEGTPEESYEMSEGSEDELSEEDNHQRRLGSIMRSIRMKHMGK